MFNLNNSRKPEHDLYQKLSNQVINTYGLPVIFLFAQKINKNEIFKDFSHMKVNPDIEQKEIYIMPEDPSDWEGDTVFNNFGFYSQWTQHLFLTRDTILELFPDFDEDSGRSKIVNNLIITPSSTILEITNIESYEPHINNLWAFNDSISAYKIAVKVYDYNIADEGIVDIKGSVKLSEDGYENNGDADDVIFEYDEQISTEGIDNFFNELQNNVDIVEEFSEKGDDKGKKSSNTNSAFGNLS